MIISFLDGNALLPGLPSMRVREEATGGSILDTASGKVVRVTEEELATWRVRAADSEGLIYYAVRSWGVEPLALGCSSSPDRIYLEVTRRCNLACPFCYRSAGHSEPEEMTTHEWLNLIRSLALIGVYELRFTGGEPTTRHDILSLIDTAIAAGFFVTLGTNGVISERMADALSERPLGRFLVSLEGLASVHDALRGTGTFDRTVGTVRRLLAAGRKVRVNTVLCRRNIAGLRDFLAFCRAEGIENVSLIVPRPLGRASHPEFIADMPGAADMEAVARFVGPLSLETGIRLEFQYNRYAASPAAAAGDPIVRKIVSCPAGTQAGFVSPEGVLYACGCASEWLSDPVKRASVVAGDLRRASPSEVWGLWQRAMVWGSFRDLKASKAPACLSCAHYGNGCFGSCPVHALSVGGRLNSPDPMCALSGNERPVEGR